MGGISNLDTRHPLEDRLGHRFDDPGLLARALTHRGAVGSRKPGALTNERFEFLGDRVLGLVIAEALLQAFPDEDEGALAPRLAGLVSTPSLARVGEALGLARHVKVAPGQRADDTTATMLADACEAVIGALYLDGGLDAARTFILNEWRVLITADLTPPKDAKTALQEWAQARGLPLPNYRVVTASGPAHAPSFVMAVAVEGYPETQGAGRTKRLATQAAAAALLANITDKVP